MADNPPHRPPLAPTDEDRKNVEALSGYGLRFSEIAALTCGGIDENTLNKYFKQELIQGKAKANGRVGQTLFQKATGGDTSAMIWWSKTQMGWKENKQEPINNPDLLGITNPIEAAQAIIQKALTGELTTESAKQLLEIYQIKENISQKSTETTGTFSFSMDLGITQDEPESL
jgi:hypothetical protein